MTAGVNARLPYGNLPRLLLAWVCTEAVRTQSRELVLGRSLYEFMHKLGLTDRSSGANGERTRSLASPYRARGCLMWRERGPTHLAGRRTPIGGSWGRSAPAPMTATGRERRAEVFHKNL